VIASSFLDFKNTGWNYCDRLHDPSGSLIPNGHRFILAGGQDILRIHGQLNHGPGVRPILLDWLILSRIEYKDCPVRAGRKEGPLWTRWHTP